MSFPPASIFRRSTSRARRFPDLEHHVERRTGRTTVQRPLQCTKRAGDRGDKIGSGGGDDTRGKRGRVQPVIDDGVEIGLERAFLLRVGRGSVQHEQEVGGVSKIGARRHGRRPATEA
jgi:hypothetical protein